MKDVFYYESLASRFCKAIKTIAEKPENLANMESYLTYHFPEWLERFANTPEDLTSEMYEFANMEF